MGIAGSKPLPDKSQLYGSEGHTLLAVFGAAAVAIGTFFAADKPLEENTQANEKEHATVLEKSANDILDEEKRLRFAEHRLDRAKEVFSRNANIRLKEQFSDMDDEYRNIQASRLRQQQKYADLMQNFLTSSTLSEKEAQRIYKSFAEEVQSKNYHAAGQFFFPMKDELAFRNECLTKAKTATPASPLPEITKSVLICARTADNRHDLAELAGAGGAGLGFALSAYYLPLVMSRRRKKDETAIKQVVTIHQKNKP